MQSKECKLSWMWVGYLAAIGTPVALYAEVVKLMNSLSTLTPQSSEGNSNDGKK